MNPAQKCSLWYLIPKDGTISTVVDMGKVLIARLSVSIITSESQLDRSMSNLTLSNIIERKPFKLCKLDYDDILGEISRRELSNMILILIMKKTFTKFGCEYVFCVKINKV